MQNTNEQNNNIDAAQQGMSEELQAAKHAAETLCEWMTPNALAELAYEWSQETETLCLAQIALDAGIRNCGLYELAGHLTHNTDYCVDEELFIAKWRKAGLRLPASEASTVAEQPRTADEDTQPCAVCGKQTPKDDLYWENPDLPYSCDLVCEDCMPKNPEDIAP